jgi:ribonuclease BN (tRNA processing enzyme)
MTFLGAGSAFTLPTDDSARALEDFEFQSNILLEEGDRKLLLDCGTDARLSLYLVGVRTHQITDVYISHLHADHIGGLECLGFSTYFNAALARPRMFINDKLALELWNRALAGGMGTLQGQIARLDTYFEVFRVKKNSGFIWQGTEFRLVQVVHYFDGFHIVPSYGLFFRPSPNGPLVFWTSDAQFAPDQIGDFYAMADLIFQDCETTPYASRVHAHYNSLRDLPAAIKSKMWLYHYQPGERPDCIADGFRGWVRRGQSFEF